MFEPLTATAPMEAGLLPLASPTPPAAPHSIAELDIPESMVFDIALRFLRARGATTFTQLRKALKVSYPLAEAIFDRLRQRQLIEIQRAIGSDYQFALTGAGKRLAGERSETCRYAGPLPVSLRHYTRVIESQRTTAPPTREMLGAALGELVLGDRTIDQLGAVFVSRKPLFVYGPTGNGKTSIVERLPRIRLDCILVPYAVEVDGHIVQVFDRLVHDPIECGLESKIDPRWICCLRPCFSAGGELVPSLLDLRLDQELGIYVAPIQMKANNGIFFIDDFGRQAITPREFLNRWIVPLDRRVDHLSLQNGFTFQIPFELMLVLATNLDPAELGDGAFLRRIPNKIFVGPPTPEMFDEIFRRVLLRHDLSAGPETAVYLRTLCSKHTGNGLRGCYPRDVIEILIAMATYQRRPVEVSPQALNVAAEMYFAKALGADGSFTR